MDLQYNQSIPPSHHLKLNNYGPFQLHQVQDKKLHSQVLALKFDDYDQYIALGCRDGSRLLYSLKEHKITQKYECLNQTSVTSVKWRPRGANNSNILATTDSDGCVTYWHIPTMKKLFTLAEKQNSILCMDFSKKGTQFATAGKDASIRVYDQETKSLNVTLQKANWEHMGHENRIFAVKFVDENLIISGGWDAVVHIWDIRQGKSIRHFKGPHISGESIDFQDGKILTGSYSATNQIQVWDFNKCQKIEQIDWTSNIDKTAYVYTAAYSKYELGVFGAGSTGAVSEVRLYKQTQDKKHKLVNMIEGTNEAVFSFDFSRNSNTFAFSTAHDGFYLYEFKRKK